MTYANYSAFLGLFTALFVLWSSAGMAQESQRVTTDDLTASDEPSTDGDTSPETGQDADDDFDESGNSVRDDRPKLEIAGLSAHTGYAYDSDYPIELGGTREGDMDSRLARYFEYVRAASGASLRYSYDGSCCPFDVASDSGGTGFLQVYLLAAPGKRPVRIYINGYAEGPLYLPRGLVSTSPDNQIDIEAAAESLHVQNHWRAEKLLTPLAEAGDMLAQYRLGRVFSDIQDPASAHAWFLKAAEQGHLLSQFTMYNRLQKGLGVARDEAAADQWLRRAAADGHAGARVIIAHKLLRKSASRDEIGPPESLLKQAAEQGEASAQGVYGLMLVHGRGSHKNLAEGLMWLYLASRGGDANAADYYERLSSEQPTRMLSRITFAAEDWHDRAAPPPVIALSDLPEISD